MLETLLRLNAGRWGGLDETARRFHHATAPWLLAAGMLRLAHLRIGGAVAAGCYAQADGGQRLMFYLIGFDPAFAAASPGSLLIGAMLDAALAEGRTEADFLRGNEAYKYAWGARDRHNAACRLTPSGT
jgi:CelD/BcsL family acetyltransferase involved in cellulose biosynthesis